MENDQSLFEASALPSTGRGAPTTPPITPPIARGRLPIIGHLASLLLRPLTLMQALSSQDEVVRLYFCHVPVYVVTSPELVRRVLVTQAADFEQGRLMKLSKAMFGDALITSDGPFHQRQRRLMQPTFHRERIARYADTMGEVVAAHAASWRPGQPLAMTKEMLALSMAIVFKTLIKSDAGSIEVAEIPRLVEILFDQLIRRTLLPSELLQKLPTPGNRRFDAANARLRRIIGSIIDRYRADGRDRGDVLSMLLLARDEHTGESMTDRQVQDEITEIIIAGHETTGSTLAWIFYELGRNPPVEKRVHAEVDAALAGRCAGFSDLAALPYTRRVVTETLRLHVPFWLVMKRTVAPVVLGRFHIPAGADVIFSPYAMSHDPSLYPEPLTFDPDRWLPDRVNDSARHAFMPFGAGKHRCIGESFSWTAMTLTTATIASRWRLRPTPGQDVRERLGLVMPPNRLEMVAMPRHL